MKTILGKKLGMTQIFDADGQAIVVTAVEAGPCSVTQIKTAEKDGYTSIQYAFGGKRKKPGKALAGHFAKSKVDPVMTVREVRIDDPSAYSLGQKINGEIFKEGDYVDVVGTSKGKGFQGVIKRHHFSGGPATHGSRFHRAVGSVGCRKPQHTVKGRKGAGRMGGERVTVQNLQIKKIMTDKNLIFITGAVPGTKGSLVVIKEAVKTL